LGDESYDDFAALHEKVRESVELHSPIIDIILFDACLSG
jgi:hypothetical protein